MAATVAVLLMLVVTVYALYRVHRATKYGTVLMTDHYGFINGSSD